MTPSHPTVVELLALLDKPTLDVLTARLHAIVEAHGRPEAVRPEQLLFGFINNGLDTCEDDDEFAAFSILETIESGEEAVA